MTVRGLFIVAAASLAACQGVGAGEPEASSSSELEDDDSFCTDDDSGESAPTPLPAAPMPASPATPSSTATVLPSTGVSGSLPSLTLLLPSIELPPQFITPRISVTPTLTCALSGQIAYSAQPAGNGQWNVTVSATVTGSCFVQVDGQRYGIIHPTIHGNTTITVSLTGTASLTSALDCATARAITPQLRVSLRASVSYTDPVIDVYGRCGGRRPILSRIATNQAREAAADAARQAQALIDAKLGEWETAANAWLAGQMPKIVDRVCGPAVVPAVSADVARLP